MATGTHNAVVRTYVSCGGAKQAARICNQRGLRYRDKLLTKDLVLEIIEETAAIGEYYWGKRDEKTGQLNPREDWTLIKVVPIIDRELFDMAQQVRAALDPEWSPGRTPSSPMLRAGLVECGQCSSGYQLETRASGRKPASTTTGARVGRS